MAFPKLTPSVPHYPPDYDRDNASNIVFPTSHNLAWASRVLTQNRAVFVRGVVSRPMRIHAISFFVSVISATNDSCDLGLFDANLQPLGTTGLTAGLLNGTTGRKSIALVGGDVTLLPRIPYYAVFSLGASAAPPSLITLAYPNSTEQLINGSGAGNPDADFMNSAPALPVATAATTATGVNALNSATVNVGSTTGFAQGAGAFRMGGVTTTYTGVTATSFTGCGNHAATVGGEAITPALTYNGGGANNPVLTLVEAV